jgi:uncharacterized coiled-coil protein SlyX
MSRDETIAGENAGTDTNSANDEGCARSIDAAPKSRPSSMRSKSLSTMPTGHGGTHQMYLEIASLQMAKARQERIRDSLRQQVDEAQRQITNARHRTSQLLAQIEDSQASSDRADETEETTTSGEPPETFEY